MKIGILLHFDPTVKMINSEILFLNKLMKVLNPDNVVFIEGMSRAKSLLKRFEFDFPYEIVSLSDVDQYDALVTWNTTNMANFFGGMVSDNFVRYYQLISDYSNNGTPILYRSGDSENEIFDYRDNVLSRAETDKKFSENNKDLIEVLNKTRPIDYSQYYMLVNGDRSRFDWVHDTYRVRKPAKFLTDQICEQALYLGDDMFFQVLDHYHRQARFLQSSQEPKDSLFWIGFIEHNNSGRKKVFKELLTNIDIPVTIQSNVEFVLPGVECINDKIEGDTINYFSYLSEFLGYIFVGKGTERCAYVNKTVYDCFIARIPVLVYSKTDKDRMIFPDHPEFYFSSRDELKELYQSLKDPAKRARIVCAQAEHIKARLADEQDLPRLKQLLKI